MLQTIHRFERRNVLFPSTALFRQQSSRLVLHENIHKQLEAVKMESAQSELVTLIARVPERNKNFYFCKDCRRCNAANIPETRALPRMDDCNDVLKKMN